MVWTKKIHDSAWEVRVKDHGSSEGALVIPPYTELPYHRYIDKSGSGIEVEFHRTTDEKMAVMIVDEDWRLKFSYAIIRAGHEKSFTPFKELVVLKHYAEVDIIFQNGRDCMLIRDVSEPSIWDKLTNKLYGEGISTLDGVEYDEFYCIVE
ncbi:hypothetical protein L484_020616 [Morus notabilis]|uniref:Uncharacterized protein n=1 Tax=Morus notabilis TaxID=981085 RepID=W9S935_9ROSA|nr:hypothetical protein L484_020616 [Morus notabilis]